MIYLFIGMVIGIAICAAYCATLIYFAENRPLPIHEWDEYEKYRAHR